MSFIKKFHAAFFCLFPFLCVSFFFLFSLSVPAFAVLKIEQVPSRTHPGKFRKVVAGQLIVKFVPGADHQKALKSAGAFVIHEFRRIGWTHVSLRPGQSVEDGLKEIQALPGVISAEPNRVHRPNRAAPSDPLFSSQWSLSQIDAFAGWNYEVGFSSRVTIAVVDSGIDFSNPDLSALAKNYGSMDCTQEGGCVPEPSTYQCDHGTHVAGVASASTNNNTLISGVSWGAQLLSLRVYDNSDCSSDTNAAVLNAFEYAALIQGSPAVGHIVINYSSGSRDGSCDGSFQEACQDVVNAGIPIVTSAGNDSCDPGTLGDTIEDPAICAPEVAGVIPVGATAPGDVISDFSSCGPELAYGVVAPGGNSNPFQGVLTTNVGSGSTLDSGTSFAAPHVAGLAALLLSAKPQPYTAAGARQIQTWIRDGAENIGASSDRQGAGRINVFNSLGLAVKGTLPAPDGKKKPIAFPNPFHVGPNGAVTFKFPDSLNGSHLSIRVYTPTGKLIRTLSNKTWDGKNEAGQFVASGAYVFYVKTDAGSGSGRLSLIH